MTDSSFYLAMVGLYIAGACIYLKFWDVLGSNDPVWKFFKPWVALYWPAIAAYRYINEPLEKRISSANDALRVGDFPLILLNWIVLLMVSVPAVALGLAAHVATYLPYKIILTILQKPARTLKILRS